MAVSFKPDSVAPATSASVTFYDAGTSTAANVYYDKARTNSAGNALSADAKGEFQTVFLDEKDYRIVRNVAGKSYEGFITGKSANSLTDEAGATAILTAGGGVEGSPAMVYSDRDTVTTARNAARAYCTVDTNGNFIANEDSYNVASVVRDGTIVGRFDVNFSQDAIRFGNGPVAITHYGITDSTTIIMAEVVSQNATKCIVQFKSISTTGAAAVARAWPKTGFSFVQFGREPNPA